MLTKDTRKTNKKISLVPGGKTVNGVFEPKVAAADLVTPPALPKFTPPVAPTINPNTSSTVSNVKKTVDGIITADTAEAQRLKELREEQSSFGINTGQMFEDRLESSGTNKNLAELKDINLRLADMTTASESRKVKIAGAGGQTFDQGLREVSQEDREEAVRQTGLAARASVLTDNINTATALARDAVSFAFQDASLELQNRTAQINDLRDVVDGQTQQLLDAELRKIEAETQRINEVKAAVQTAILAGADQATIDRMLSPNTSNEDKFTMAMQVIGSTSRSDRELDRAAKGASINASNLSARKSLLELAALGDESAIDELGFDPRSLVPELSETEQKDARDRVRAGSNLSTLLTQYKSLVDTFGFEGGILGDKDVLGKYNSLRGQIVAEYKDAKQLGTLDAGLLKLADQIIGELPEGNVIINNFSGFKSRKISSQLDAFLSETNRQLAQDKMLLGDLSAVLDDDDLGEINEVFGVNTTTPAMNFNPAAFYR